VSSNFILHAEWRMEIELKLNERKMNHRSIDTGPCGIVGGTYPVHLPYVSGMMKHCRMSKSDPLILQ
jgi:hypothetical protein